MTKIAEAIQNKKAFIGFLTAGDPSLECTEKFIIKISSDTAAPAVGKKLPFSIPIVFFSRA